MPGQTQTKPECGYPCIVSAAHAMGGNRVSTQELIDRFSIETTADWVDKHTGIRYRYEKIPGKEFTSTLAIKAGKSALELAGMRLDELSGLIVATTTPDYFIPATAFLVAGGLAYFEGRPLPEDFSADHLPEDFSDYPLPEDFSAHDINAACTGGLYAIETASNRLEATKSDLGMVAIGAETLSTFYNPKRKDIVILFGDGAGSFVLRNDPEAELPQRCAFRTVPDFRTMNVEHGGSRHPESGPGDPKRQLEMIGRKVKDHASDIMPSSAKLVAEKVGIYDESLGDKGIDWSQIDYVVAHQSNARMIEAFGEQLGIPKEKLIITVGDHGNTSAASMLIALSSISERLGLKPGVRRIMFVAIGAGFGGGAAIMNVRLGVHNPKSSHNTNIRHK